MLVRFLLILSTFNSFYQLRMKAIFFSFFMFFACYTVCQEKLNIKYLSIKCDFAGNLFYSKEKIKAMTVVFVTEDMLSAMNLNVLLDSQAFAKNSEQEILTQDTLVCNVKLKYHPDISEIRKVLEKANLNCIYINGKKYWVKSLLNKEEVWQAYVKFNLKEVPAGPNIYNPEAPEYYEYKIFSLNTKLRYMMGGDYQKYLFDGYITKFYDDIDNAMKDQQDYLNNNN